MKQLEGKKALVTGAASGIGRAIALELARHQVDLFLVDIDADGLILTQKDAIESGVQVERFVGDVSDTSQIAEACQDFLDLWNSPDILINNAGICYYGRTTEMSDQRWNQLLAVNVHAPAEFARRLLPAMLDHSGSHIVNIASMYGFMATNHSTAYHLSKFAMLGFSEALRAEFGKTPISVSAVCPGYVETNLFDNMADPQSEAPVRRPPRWLCASAEKVARKTIRAIRRDRRMTIVTPLAHTLWWVRRIAPGLIDTLYRFGRNRALKARLARRQSVLPKNHSNT